MYHKEVHLLLALLLNIKALSLCLFFRPCTCIRTYVHNNYVRTCMYSHGLLKFFVFNVGSYIRTVHVCMLPHLCVFVYVSISTPKGIHKYISSGLIA